VSSDVHTVLLHNREELDNDLGARADHNLTLALLLSVVDGVEAVIEDGRASHLGGIGKSLKIFLESVDLLKVREISQGRTVEVRRLRYLFRRASVSDMLLSTDCDRVESCSFLFLIFRIDAQTWNTGRMNG